MRVSKPAGRTPVPRPSAHFKLALQRATARSRAKAIADPNGFGYGHRPAGKMPVAEFRQILVWPLALAHPGLTSAPTNAPWQSSAQLAASVADALAAQKDSRWKEQPDGLKHILRHTNVRRPEPKKPKDENGTDDKPDDAPRPSIEKLLRTHSYCEYVFFHPFVQRFLYASPNSETSGDHAGFRLFQRNDLKRLEVDIPTDFPADTEARAYTRFRLAIDRLNLYVFDCGVAILALEVVGQSATDYPAKVKTPATETPSDQPPAPRDLTVADVQRFQNAFRRCYAPYALPAKDSKWHPHEVPSRVAFYENESEADISPKIEVKIDPDTFKDAEKAAVSPDGARQMPFFKHWCNLLPLDLDGVAAPSLDLDGVAAPSDGALRWRHVVDDRMPSLALVLTRDDPRQMRRGDHIRLAFLDNPSSGDYPYEHRFLQSFEADNCYDRFWDMSTRQMFTGYGYCVLAKDGEFSRNTLAHHFRRHYFQIALLSHMEQAALLTYSNWITEALATDPHRLGATFSARVIAIKEEVLRFVHQYRFTGLSNQLQPQEMQALWRRHLKLDALFEDVSQEIETARDFLFAKENRDQTQATTNISTIAGLAAVVGLPMAFLGTNFITDSHVFGTPVSTTGGAWTWLMACVAMTSFLAWEALLITNSTTVSDWRQAKWTSLKHMWPGSSKTWSATKKLQQLMLRLMAVALAVILLIIGAQMFGPELNRPLQPANKPTVTR